jgi:hypothetical protein
MKFCRSILLNIFLPVLLALMPFISINAQVTASVVVLPPYSPDIEDYADKTRITVLAMDFSEISCNLRITITGDNGIMMASSEEFSYPHFTVQNAVPVTLSGPDLTDYFDLNHLNVRGIAKSELQSQGLPPGNYQVCAVVYIDGVPVSAASPSGCSNYFGVNYLQPPMLISPADQSVIENTLAQQIIFTWTPSPGAPVWTSYILKIVEINDPSQDPSDAMLTATTPAFFEQEVSGTSFLYGPSQPLLDPGKKYAFQVIASDMETRTKFENLGRSEVFSFQYGKESDNIFSMVEEGKAYKPPVIVQSASAKSWTIPNSSLSGTLQYVFPQDQSTKGLLKNIPVTLRIGYYLLSQNNEKVYLERNLEDYQCTQFLTQKIGTYSINYNVDYHTDTLPGIGTDISFYTTDPDGKFNFMFNNPGLGLVAKKITANRTTLGLPPKILPDGTKIGGKESTTEVFQGDLYMYVRIFVDNYYYTSPGQDITVAKGEDKDAGTINAYVRSYDLQVKVKADKSYGTQYKPENVESMVVYLLRAYRPDDVPEKEGKGSQPVEPGEKMFNMQVIAKEITKNTGIATIRNLVKNQYNKNERYFLYATALASSEVNYTMDNAVEYYNYCLSDEAVYNPEYVIPSPTPIKELIARPLPPAIKGSVYRYDDQMKPVSGATVKLFKFISIVGEKNTGSNGKFNFDITDSKEGDSWGIYVTNSGFKSKYVTVPFSLILGKKFVREDILLEPESTVSGTVANEEGKGIIVHMRMEDGAYKEFTPVCSNILNIDAENTASTAYINLGQTNTAPGTPQVVNNINIYSSNNVDKSFVAGNPVANRAGNLINVSSSGDNKNLNLKDNSKSVIDASMIPTCTSPTPYTLYSVSGNRKIIIDPVDPKYLNDTIPVSVLKGANTIVPITVFTNKHRVLVTVKEKVGAGAATVGNPIAGAKVTIDNVGTIVTNTIGEARFEFEGAADTVKVRVQGPDAMDYVAQVKTAVVNESKNFRVVPVVLKAGGRIRGTVYAGTTDSSAVAGARVFVDIPGETKIECLTNDNGVYVLRNVPLTYTLMLRAVKSASNFIGDSTIVKLTKDNSSQTTIKENVNFHLTVFNDMDISKMLGFPIEVTRLTLGGKGGNDVFISGNFTDIPGNEYFSVLSTESDPRFNNVAIIPSLYMKNDKGVPLSQPKDNKVSTNKNKLGVNLYKNFKADIIGDQLLGLEVVDISKGTGAIAGRIKFDEGSFTTSLVTFKEQVYLTSGNGKMRLAAFSTEPQYIKYPTGLHISDINGGPLAFNFDKLNLEANPQNSAINGDTLYLNAVLHTGFKHIPTPDAALALGKMVFVKNASQQVSFNNIYGKNLTIKLSGSSVPWSLQIDNWMLGKTNGLQFINGYVNTGIVTVPFTDIFVDQVADSTMLKGGNFQLDQLSLANIVTLNITGQKQFGFDLGRNAWKLSVSGLPGQPCASFGGLLGMATGDKVEIENFFFISNNNPVFNIYQGAKPLTLFNVGSFTPGMITVINGDIGIAGMIDYKIPYMNSGNNLDYKIFYFKNDDQTIGFRNEVAAFLITPPGPVTMEFFPVTGTQTLDNNGFFAKGKVYEKIGADKLFEFDAWLYRTTDSTSLVIDQKSNPMFSFSGYSGPRLENVHGRMYLNGTEWTQLRFGGDLKNANGASGSLSFVVQGDLVADQQQISVENIPMPFSNIMNMTYDFANKRFTGVIDFGQTLAGGAAFSASAEVLFDPTGWYFLGLGSISLPSPQMGGQASIFIGSYRVNQHIIDKFIPNSRVYQLFGEPPANFPVVNQQFKGFYIEGGAQIPIPILPSFEFNLGLISAQLSHEVGADLRMGMNFANANTYSMGVSVFGRITAGLGASMGLVCASSTVTGKGLISADGMYSTNGSWSATGYVDFSITGNTELGFGACDSDCDGILGVGPCVVDSESASVGLFGKFTISDGGTDFEFGFK